MRPFALRRALICVLAVAGALWGGTSSGDELLALIQQSPGQIDVMRAAPTPMDLSSVTMASATLTGVLATRDGSDLLFFGQNSSSLNPILFRVGRTAASASPSDLTGPFVNVMLGTQVLLSTTTSVAPAAAWVGSTSRHIALALGANQVTFHEPIEPPAGTVLPTATPDGWNVSSVSWATTTGCGEGSCANYKALLVASSQQSGGSLFVYGEDTSNNNPQLFVIQPSGAIQTGCSINGEAHITAMAAMPAGQGIVVALQNGALAILPETCNAAQDPVTPASTMSGGYFTALDTGASASMAGQSVIVGSAFSNVLQAWSFNPASSAVTATATDPNPTFGGAVALMGGARVLLGGVQGGNQGYEVETLAGNSLNVSQGPFSASVPAVVRAPAPTFGLSARVIDLNGVPVVARERSTNVQVFGTAGHTLTVYPGTCTQTEVFAYYDETTSLAISNLPCTGNAQCASNQCNIKSGTCACTANSQCASGSCLLDSGSCEPVIFNTQTTPGSFIIPSTPAGLTFSQVAGEDCMMTVADPTVGGGAIVRLHGGTRALALVLDLSGSMAGQVDPSQTSGPGTDIRIATLRSAVGTTFINLLNALPSDVVSLLQVILVPFDQLSNMTQPPEGMAPLNGTQLIADMATIQGFQANGNTNIAGALLTAAQRLNEAVVTATERSILLVSDGMHNTIGTPNWNSTTTTGQATWDVTGTAAALQQTGQKVDRVYALGLGASAPTNDLMSLVRLINSPSSTGTLPPGYLSYADSSGNQVPQFFTKVLWDYLGASEYLDPLVTINDGMTYTQQINLTAADPELFVHVTWENPANHPLVQLAFTDANAQLTTVTCDGAQQPDNTQSVACSYSPQMAVNKGGEQFKLTVQKGKTDAAGPYQVMVEVAGRSNVRMVPSLGQVVYHTGQTIQFQVALTEEGLPIHGAKVTAQLTGPAGALGTVLGNAQIAASAIQAKQQANPDVSAAGAKYLLLSAGQIPGESQQNVTLFDDGQHGDRAANDGIYGVAVPAPLPGTYSMTAQASFDTRLSAGTGITRGASLSTLVVTNIVNNSASVKFTSFTPATPATPATMVVALKPQDQSGNLLGPGNGGDIHFRQGPHLLPATITEPPTLDGSYTATAGQMVAGGGPVYLETTGTGFVLVPDPTKSPLATPPGQGNGGGGCNCDVNRQASLPLPAFGVLLIGLLLRRRRAQNR